MSLPRSGREDKSKNSSNTRTHENVSWQSAFRNSEHCVSHESIPRYCPRVPTPSPLVSSPSLGTSCSLDETSFEIPPARTGLISSPKVQEEEQDSKDDQYTYVPNHIATQPRMRFSSYNRIDLNQMESTDEDDRPEGLRTPETESDSGKDEPPRGFTPDGIQEQLRSSSNLEMLNSSSPSRTITRELMGKRAVIVPNFDPEWAAKLTKQTGERESVPASSSRPNRANPTNGNSSSYDGARKLSQENERDTPADGDDGLPEDSRLLLCESLDSRGILKLACPYRKHDAGKYNQDNYLACATRSWNSTARVKQHLKRCHMALPFCIRCKETFETPEALKSHMEVPNKELLVSCELRDGPYPEGITPEMDKQISRRSATKSSEEERWSKIYEILFPGELIPKPYFDLTPDIITPSGQSIGITSSRRPSWHELQLEFRIRVGNSSNDHIRSLPEDALSELARIAVQCYQHFSSNGPANQAGCEEVLRSTCQPENAFTSQNLASETQRQASWQMEDVTGATRSNGSGRHVGAPTLEPSVSLPAAHVEPSVPNRNIVDCTCEGLYEHPPGECPSSIMQDYQFRELFPDNPTNEADHGAEPYDMNLYTYLNSSP